MAELTFSQYGQRKKHSWYVVLFLVQVLAVWEPTVLVQAGDTCAQDDLLNRIACRDLALPDCSKAGQAGAGGDPNLGTSIVRQTSPSAFLGLAPYSFRGGSSSVVADAETCCESCAETPGCNLWEFGSVTLLSSSEGVANCFIFTSGTCDLIAASLPNNPPPSVTLTVSSPCPDCTFGSGPNIAQGRCSADGVITLGPVETPKCKAPQSFTAVGAACTVPSPDASALYADDLALLASSGVSLNPPLFDGSSTPSTTLAVGAHTYTLTATNGDSTSAACSGEVTVLPAEPELPPLICNLGTGLQAEEGCDIARPDAVTVYGGTYSSVYPLTLAIVGDPLARLSALVAYSYTVSVTNCGVSRRSCTGNLLITAGTTPPPQCKDKLTITADSDCVATTPSGSDLFKGTTLPTDPLTLNIGGAVPRATLFPGIYNYELTIGSSCGVTSDPCTGQIEVVKSPVPAPSCTTVTLPATKECRLANPPNAAAVFSGTSLPEDQLTLSVKDNPTSYPVGIYDYTLTNTRCGVTSDACTGQIKVEDQEELVAGGLSCKLAGSTSSVPTTIVPLYAGTPAAMFTVTYLGGSSKANGCPVTLNFPSGSAVTCDRCNKAGQREVPNCKATVTGNTLTITESGGVGDHISWTPGVTDGTRSVTKPGGCGVCVENPNGKGVCKAGWVPGTAAPCPGS